MGKLRNILSLLLLSGLVAGQRNGDHDKGSNGDHDKGSNGGRQKDWNPFQNPFNFQTIPNVPAGFGQFPSFPTNNFGNSNFGFANSFGQPSNGDRPKSMGTGGFGFPAFADFQKQFATQFPSFWQSPNVIPSADVSTTVASVSVASSSSAASTTTTTTTTTTTVAPVQQQTTPPANSITVTNRNCSNEGAVIGLSQLSTDQCGSVECQCFKGVYFCYSTCNPPPTGQSCTPTVPTGGSDVCPQYSNCSATENSTVGASQIFRCNGPVHPSVCWLYEILFGKLTEPLGFFESQAQGCPLSTHCVCGPDGFVQPAQFRQEDFKTPANNVVFPRSTPGKKSAFASS